MTPELFIRTWSGNSLSERQGAQAHFEDLCQLLDVEPPRKDGDYCYEQGLEKRLGGKGFADVWKRGCFAWENKGPEKDLRPALMQLKNYAEALENPKVLVVCNRERIELHPRFNGYPSTPRIILLQDISKPDNLQALRWLFSSDTIDKLRPAKSNAAITKEAAGDFARIAERMRARGLDGQQVAHFLIQCIFCMYAEDEALLHRGPVDDPAIFTGILRSAREDCERARSRIANLFTAMQTGGQYGNNDIAWFNGGLFKTIEVPELSTEDLSALRHAAESLDWRAIDPTIFGTLFERGLDPSARAPLGAHYTDVETINKLIRPLVIEPLAADWEEVKPLLQKATGKAPRSSPYKTALNAFQAYLERLKNFRVLDPACGSGNFLYLAMRALKDLEHAAQIDAELLGFGRQISIETGPQNVMGIEINEYAAELARVTVWIGDIQWSQSNGRPIANNPILRSLDMIEHRDALINADGSEARWPAADVIVGNPPFLGDRKMIRELGATYTTILRTTYSGKVPGGADLVCYWFHKAREHILAGMSSKAGFVATNSIRGGANRKVLDAITKELIIFNAWEDENWVNDGASVRVSLIAFHKATQADTAQLNGLSVDHIHSDLSASNGARLLDLTQAQRLDENKDASFIGTQKNGPFDLPGDIAREWLQLPNPNGRPNSDVIRLWANGRDITRRPSDTWVIDFDKLSEVDASLYEKPFEHVVEHVKPTRVHLRRDWHRTHWWCFGDPRPALKMAVKGLGRFISTSMVAKYRLFVWLPEAQIPENLCVVIPRADDTTFGILHSRFHEVWSLRLCTFLGVGNDPRYTPSSTFETFPFPQGLTPAHTKGFPILEEGLHLPPAASGCRQHAKNIAQVAYRLNQLREAWLNPPDWVDRVPEVVAGYPDRIVPKPEHASELMKRTLTNLYNQRPAWLDYAHKALDKAVADAYGWDDYSPEMGDDELLHRLLALNIDRAGGQQR